MREKMLPIIIKDSTKWFLFPFAVLLSICLFTMCSSRKEGPLHITLVYDSPVNGYYVTGEFYPFDETSETGQVELRFTPVNGGKPLVFSNVGQYEKDNPEYPLKFTGKNIIDYCLRGNFDGYHTGDTLHCHYFVTNEYYQDSPLFYDAEFQFFDVDFDGKLELLINDYDKSRTGNHYSVYEITTEGFVLREEEPFTEIDNTTRFIPESRQIVTYNPDGAFSTVVNTYSLSEAGEVINKDIQTVVE